MVGEWNHNRATCVLCSIASIAATRATGTMRYSGDGGSTLKGTVCSDGIIGNPSHFLPPANFSNQPFVNTRPPGRKASAGGSEQRFWVLTGIVDSGKEPASHSEGNAEGKRECRPSCPDKKARQGLYSEQKRNGTPQSRLGYRGVRLIPGYALFCTAGGFLICAFRVCDASRAQIPARCLKGSLPNDSRENLRL